MLFSHRALRFRRRSRTFRLAHRGFSPRGALHHLLALPGSSLGLRPAAELHRSSAATPLNCHVSLLAFHASCTIQPPLTYRSSLLSLGHVKTFFHVTRLLAVFMLHSWCIHGVWLLSCNEVQLHFVKISPFLLGLRPPRFLARSARRLPPEFMVSFAEPSTSHLRAIYEG